MIDELSSREAAANGQGPPPDAPMVRVEAVSKRFGDALAVDAVSFDLAAGSFLTILGPSGSGKTTVLRMIAGFIPPDAGRIEIRSQPVEGVPPYLRSIGMVFQRLALFPHLTAAENVAYPLKMRGWPKAGTPDRVEHYLDLVRLGGFGGRRIHELSGGQQQRVAIARALVFEPDLLLLDEPLAALDRKLREDLQLEFRDIQKRLGVTTINVTHDQREALVMSDQVLVMDQGRIQQHAEPGEAYARPANRFVAGFIGVTNFLPAVVLGNGMESGRIEVEIAHRRFQCRAPYPIEAGTRVEAAIRAERLKLLAPDDSEESGFVVAVREVIFEGDRLVYVLHNPVLEKLGIAGGHLVAFAYDNNAGQGFRVGDRVVVRWRPEDLLIFPV